MQTSDLTHDDPQECFEHAIYNGTLSDDADAGNYAGHFMYMGTAGNHDLFKDRMTREYRRSPHICNM